MKPSASWFLILCFIVALVPATTHTFAQDPVFTIDGRIVSEREYRAALLIKQAVLLSRVKRLTEAKQKLLEAARLAPDFADVRYNLAVVLSELGEEKSAAEHFEWLVVTRADFPLAWPSLGEIWLKQGKHHEAVNVFVDALKRYPEATWQNQPQFYHNFGVALLKVGETERAIEQLSRGTRAAGDLPETWLMLGTLYHDNGRYTDAVRVFTEARRRFSDQTWENKPDFFHNYGLALARVGAIEQAVSQLKIALRAKNQLAESWIALGSLYQATGRLDESLSAYHEFLQRFPDRPEAIVVTDLIKLIQGELQIAGAQADQKKQNDSADYYALITRNGARAWPPKQMPLRVHIQSGEDVPGFAPRYADFLKAAFEEWSRASEGKLTFRFIDAGSTADITCSWTNDVSRLSNRSEGGETRLQFEASGVIRKANITILTARAFGSRLNDEDNIKFIALHEIGHALGLTGHSQNAFDVMYFSEPVTSGTKELSVGDRRTIVRLYSSLAAAAASDLRPAKKRSR